jgi:hypothetical protein
MIMKKVLTSGLILLTPVLFPLTILSQENKSLSSLAEGCLIPTASAELYINNVRALIHSGGDMWWDLYDKAMYEVPAGFGKTALFAGAVWMGGLDANNQLHLCAIRYRAHGTDYFTGPLITSGSQQGTTSTTVCLKYDKMFKINREDVVMFRDWFNSSEDIRQARYPGYTIPDVILNWPGNGDVAAGYDQFLAPFYDADGDGIYNANQGDYPYYDLDNELPCKTSREDHKVVLKGDQTIWWVYNDNGNIHTDPVGDAMKVEIRAQAFAYAGSSVLNNSTFYHYQIINRSNNIYSDTYLGLWTDADLGSAWDDYVGCDVSLGLGYLYNGDNIDGSGESYAYGGPTPPPPAIGIDFLLGPYQDADFLDNPSSWDTITGQLNCNSNIFNGNINGQGFADGIVDNERWGMTHFIAFNCDPNPTGSPENAWHFYYYLKGRWKDNTPIYYEGNGYCFNPDTSDIPSAYLFPGNSDPCGWGTGGVPQNPWDEITENNPPGDRRFVISTGPITFEPGQVNDFLLGAIWSRAMSGDNLSSVALLKTDDDNIQKLFDHCMKGIIGPHAPELKIIELRNELVFHLYNLPASNNYLEKYDEQDYTISNIDTNLNGTIDTVDKHYRFEGYQVFQLRDSTVGFNNLWDPDFARLVYQCDLKNGVGRIINYEWSTELNTVVPVVKVEGTDAGIGHSFSLKADMFSESGTLPNYKKCYFIPIAYAYNNYQTFNLLDPFTFQGQKTPYLAGQRSVFGPLKVYTAMAHPTGSQNPASSYGQEPEIMQVHGMSGAGNILELTDETLNEILSGPPWYAATPVYKSGQGPIKVRVIDPLNLPEAGYVLKFDSVDYHAYNYSIHDSKYYIIKYLIAIMSVQKSNIAKVHDNPAENAGGSVNLKEFQSGSDTVWSDSWISSGAEQLIPQWGISVTVNVVNFPIYQTSDSLGYLSSSIEFSDTSNQWINFLQDDDLADAQNWIRAGTYNDPNHQEYNDYFIHDQTYDENQVYESILSGTFAPYKLASHFDYGPAYDSVGCHHHIELDFQRLAGVDLVITSDKSKWTRCCVIETSENDTTISGDPIPGMNVVGGAYKFDLRRSPSVDKDGNSATPGSGPSDDEDAPNYISDNGMGWFPGFAINVETGERLNMMFGEASELQAYNGRDMKWNPTADVYTKLGEPVFGGMHFIYIMGHYWQPKDSLSGQFPYMPLYDEGRYVYNRLSRYDLSGSAAIKRFKQSIYRNAMWICIPLLNPAFSGTSFSENLEKSDIKIRLRISNPISNTIADSIDYDTININVSPTASDTSYLFFPQYWFTTQGIAYQQNDTSNLFTTLDSVHIVPNPYYCYSEYETSESEYIVKIINLPEKCTISVYSLNGTLVTRIRKYNSLGFQDWDLRNNHGRKIAGGVYLVHIKADGIGEKTIKWAGAIRK